MSSRSKVLVLTAAVLMFASMVSAQSVVIDDFEDGDYDEWTTFFGSGGGTISINQTSTTPFDGEGSSYMWMYSDAVGSLFETTASIGFPNEINPGDSLSLLTAVPNDFSTNYASYTIDDGVGNELEVSISDGLYVDGSPFLQESEVPEVNDYTLLLELTRINDSWVNVAAEDASSFTGIASGDFQTSLTDWRNLTIETMGQSAYVDDVRQEVDLTGEFAFENPDPFDGETDVSDSTTLGIDVSNSAVNLTDIRFYWSNGTLISEFPNLNDPDVSVSTSSQSLQYGETYGWYVEAEATDGTNATSETYSFTTQSAPDTGAPTFSDPYPPNNVYGWPGSTAFNITVDDPEGSDIADIKYYWSNGTLIEDVLDTTQSPPVSHPTDMFDNLQANTTYLWYVEASDAQGNTALSIQYNFTTDDGTVIPPNIDRVEPADGATNVEYNETQFLVEVSHPEGDNIDEIRFEWANGTVIRYGGALSSEARFENFSTSDVTQSFDKLLEPDTSYSFRVYVEDENGDATYSDDITFSTGAEIDDDPEGKPEGTSALEVFLGMFVDVTGVSVADASAILAILVSMIATVWAGTIAAEIGMFVGVMSLSGFAVLGWLPTSILLVFAVIAAGLVAIKVTGGR
jgi:hypothetical protein